jgi:hypothetical protein
MAAPVWKTYAVRPLGLAGVASLLSWVVPGSDAVDDKIQEICACFAFSPVLNPMLLPPEGVRVSIRDGINIETYAENLPSLLCVCSWFARTSAGWQAGPVLTALALSSSLSGGFNYPKNWIIEMLQRLEHDSHPLGAGVTMPIRSAYPRDNFPAPCVSVNFEASTAGTQFLGDVSRLITPTRREEQKGWDVQIDLILWTFSVEKRDQLAPWFNEACHVVEHFCAQKGIHEPKSNINEGEDFSFSKAEVPLFYSAVTITGSMFSWLEVPIRNPIGHFSV